MKRFLNLFLLLVFTCGFASAITIDQFIKYCSDIKEVKVIKSNRFNLDDAVGMEIETGNMIIIPDATQNVLNNVQKKLDQISDTKFLPVVQQKDNGNITRVYLEQNGNNSLKRLIVVTIDSSKINILNVKGRINDQIKK